jgi:hypothetical protein
VNRLPVKIGTPEERELEAKLAELSRLQAVLVDRELELATLEAELAAFERLYLSRLGSRYATLDELEAQIAERDAARPHAGEAERARAAEARTRAEESARATADAADIAEQPPPSKELKDLFREVAKAVHPDLAATDAERAERERLMAAANEAYRARDVARLQQILAEWRDSPDAVPGEDVASRLIRTIRNIARVISRIQELDQSIEAIRTSDMLVLKARIEAAAASGQNLWAVLERDLDGAIAALRQRLQQDSRDE